MPATETLSSEALFRRAPRRCRSAFRTRLHRELQINTAPRPSSSPTKSLQGQAPLSYAAISPPALPRTACRKPAQLKVTQAPGRGGAQAGHRAGRPRRTAGAPREKAGRRVSHPAAARARATGAAAKRRPLAEGKRTQGTDRGQLPLPERCTAEKRLQTKIVPFPDRGNFASPLRQVIQRWLSHEPAKESLRFVGCAVGEGFG